ncbi:MAG: cobalamin B12-binding domain-containing protein [Rhodobacterales bacterium]|nr:cobalamin B12-binding domain-containing protein [Rhodobacterales bacterium]
MSESPHVGLKESGNNPDDLVETLAERALKVVATHKGPRLADPKIVARLVAVATSRERAGFGPAVAEIQRQGIRCEEIADLYVPAVARALGEAWVDDGMGFAMVTIGCSRLHALLRDLGPEWRADSMAPANAPSVLVLACADAQHTLGATLLTGQLRRRGLSVRILVDAQGSDVAEVLRKAHFDGVLISVAAGDPLEVARKLVATVRRAPAPVPPVVIGGSILGSRHVDVNDILRITGATMATNVASEALDHCGIRTGFRSAPHSVRRN